MEIFVDFQGFRGQHDEFIIKELATSTIEPDGSEVLTNTIFKPPFPWESLSSNYQRLNKWIIRNHHGIGWNNGNASYDQLKRIINTATKNKNYIYVKGNEKKIWLKSIVGSLKSVIDLDNFNCPSLKERRLFNCHFCDYHKDVYDDDVYWCALENVKVLKSWFLKNCVGEPSLDRSLDIYCKLNKCIADMKPEDIAFFPKNFIIEFAANDITRIWDKLPDKLKNDPDIIKYSKCRKHYNLTAIDYDEVDNLIPLTKDCNLCKKK